MERHGQAAGGLTLGATLAEAARRFGSRPAVVDADGAATTYAELDDASDGVADGLLARGLGPGAVLALLLPSSPAYLALYVGAAKAGVTTAGINPRMSSAQRATMVDVADPALVVGTGALLDGCARDRPTVEILSDVPDSLEPVCRRGRGSRPAADTDRVVALVFTSGTTGAPKAAMFSEGHLDAIRRLDVGDADWGTAGPMLASTELVHIGVMTKLAWYLRTGCTLHLLRRWRAADALRVISANRLRSVGAIAPQVALMLRDPTFDDHDFSTVETIVAGGAPSPPSLIVEARRRFGAAYSVRYSSTESGGVGTATAFDAPPEEALHTVGRPRAGVEVRVVAGEVQLRSPAVMAGYWRDPAATAARIDGNGWLRTGDLGIIGDDGCLRLHGRADDAYVRGGYNVHPEHVEAALADHPDLADVAVVPRADPVLGQIGVAVVVPRATAVPPTLDELRRHARAWLAHHELPEAIVVLDRLPRTPLHKLDRAALRHLTGPPPARLTGDENRF